MARTAQKADIELALIRILSVRGRILSGDGVSAADRQERIRVAILADQLPDKPFADFRTFAQAFEICYGRKLEQRRLVRDRHGRPTHVETAPHDEEVE